MTQEAEQSLNPPRIENQSSMIIFISPIYAASLGIQIEESFSSLKDWNLLA